MKKENIQKKIEVAQKNLQKIQDKISRLEKKIENIKNGKFECWCYLPDLQNGKVCSCQEFHLKFETRELNELKNCRDLKYYNKTIIDLTIELKRALEQENKFNDYPECLKTMANQLVIVWNEFDIKNNDGRYTVEQINKQNETSARLYVTDLYNKIVNKTGDFIKWNVFLNGNTLNGYVNGTKGTAHIETILAGGYNIQRLHARTIVK